MLTPNEKKCTNYIINGGADRNGALDNHKHCLNSILFTNRNFLEKLQNLHVRSTRG